MTIVPRRPGRDRSVPRWPTSHRAEAAAGQRVRCAPYVCPAGYGEVAWLYCLIAQPQARSVGGRVDGRLGLSALRRDDRPGRGAAAAHARRPAPARLPDFTYEATIAATRRPLTSAHSETPPPVTPPAGGRICPPPRLLSPWTDATPHHRLRLLGLRPPRRQVARPVPGLRRVEHARRGGARAAAGRRAAARRAAAARAVKPVPARRRPRGAPRPAATGHRRARPRARRRARARLARAARRLARHRQVDADVDGARQPRRAPGGARSTSRARSPRRRSACAPSGCRARRSTCRCWPRPTSTRCSRRSTPSAPRSA